METGDIVRWQSARRAGARLAKLHERLVERAATIPFRVEQHAGEACSTQRVIDRIAEVPRPRHLGGRELDACAIIVVSHAQLEETESPQRSFATLDGPEAVRCDGDTVRQPARQTRRRRLIPRRQLQLPRQLAYLRLRQPCLEQRGADAVLATGGKA